MLAGSTKKLPHIHPRHAPVAEARLALGRTLHILEEQFELTAAELMVLLSAELQSLASSCVREERK